MRDDAVPTPLPGGAPPETEPELPPTWRRRRRRRHHRRRGHDRRRRGADLAGVAGLAIGAVIGLPLGLLTYLVVRETVLPFDLWASDTAMWSIIFAVAIPASFLGLVQGASPSRMGHALVVGLVAFLLGTLVFFTAGGVLAFAFWWGYGAWRRWGAWDAARPR